MWRNMDVLNFVAWLHEYNRSRAEGRPPVGFYGLDLYSLHTSIEAVLNYLDKVDPAGAQRARYRYSCFEDYGEDPQHYGYAAAFGLDGSCEGEAVNQLVDLLSRQAQALPHDGRLAEDELFYAQQNARLVKNAEAYYRTMFRGQVASWNLRDRHMAQTLDALNAHLSRAAGGPARIVVWAHNSHLGDARATERSERGELDLGQLVRERYGPRSLAVGLTTYTGTVTAASDWDGPAGRKQVNPALEGSYEYLFHQTAVPAFYLDLGNGSRVAADLRHRRLERAIGVIYRPETERLSHYFYARLADQFDAVLHFDKTQAVAPLDRSAEWTHDEVPETFPTGV
jgi:erythromycin esterase-like protein